MRILSGVESGSGEAMLDLGKHGGSGVTMGPVSGLIPVYGDSVSRKIKAERINVRLHAVVSMGLQ
jgi:hypothetical protein